jgi:predicted metal-dependent phosphoesterase TrpH
VPRRADEASPQPLIDLHTHTDASDGRLTSADLVRRAWSAGIRVLGVTDHDTLAGLSSAHHAAEAFGLTLIDGVEVTAVERGRDIHVLGYFVNTADSALDAFLARQREQRTARVKEIGARLLGLGAPIDVERLLSAREARGGAIGRPAIAAALIEAGHVSSLREAFDRFLGEGGAAWVPRQGPMVPQVIDVLHSAGAIASLAHPVLNRCDERISEWAAVGLDAIEVFHSEHQPDDVARYRALADALGLAMTGGSDYHGHDHKDHAHLGSVTLPPEALERLRTLARRA